MMSVDFVYFRPAKVNDSKRIAKIEYQFFSRYPNYFNAPSPSKKYRREISNLLDKNPLYLVAEKRGEVIASIKVVFDDYNKVAKVGYPIGDINEPGIEEFQMNLVELAIENSKQRGMNTISASISNSHLAIQELFRKNKFRKKKIIVELWESRIMARVHELPNGYTIRPPKASDLASTWEWIKEQMVPEGPMGISYETYEHIFLHSTESKDGWAVVEKEGEPYAIVSSFISPSNTAVIFGPFCKKRYHKLRIPLLNELLWHYSIKGVQVSRIIRSKSFMNDKKLFEEFNYTLIESQYLFQRTL